MACHSRHAVGLFMGSDNSRYEISRNVRRKFSREQAFALSQFIKIRLLPYVWLSPLPIYQPATTAIIEPESPLLFHQRTRNKKLIRTNGMRECPADPLFTIKQTAHSIFSQAPPHFTLKNSVRDPFPQFKLQLDIA